MSAFARRRERAIANAHRQLARSQGAVDRLLQRRRDDAQAEQGIAFRVETYEASKLRGISAATVVDLRKERLDAIRRANERPRQAATLIVG